MKVNNSTYFPEPATQNKKTSKTFIHFFIALPLKFFFMNLKFQLVKLNDKE